MKMKVLKAMPILFILMLWYLSVSTVYACTGIQLKAKDGSYINGRTVEFGMALNLSGVVIPRNYELKATLPDGSTSFLYRTKYAAVGGSAFGASDIMDGMNEKGLTIGIFYFPGFAQYAEMTPENKNKSLSPTEFSTWILSQFATTNEVKEGIKAVAIAPTTPKGWPGLPPFHYVVYDKTGSSIVIEPINGQLKVYDNPIGVLTNSPTFDWHLTNLANYINLSAINAPPVTIDGLKLKQLGEGSGLHGLPGDFTPPSRFVRAAVFATTAIAADNAQQSVFQTFHILNQFDIPIGSVRDMEKNTVVPEYTLATTVKDPQNLKYYFRTYEDQTIRVISLNSFDLNTNKIKFISMKGIQPVTEVSNTAL